MPLSRRIPSLSTFLVHMEEERDRRDPARSSVCAGLYREFLSALRISEWVKKESESMKPLA